MWPLWRSGAVWRQAGWSGPVRGLGRVGRDRRLLSSGGGASGGRDWARLRALLGGERVRLSGALGLLLVSSGATMLVPFALGRIIDLIAEEPRPAADKPPAEPPASPLRGRLSGLAVGLFGVFTVGALCNFGRVYLMRLSSQRMSARLRQDLFNTLMGQELAFFERHATGELVNRLSADAQLVSQTLTQQVSDGTRNAVMTGAGVGMMLYMSPQLTVVGLSVVPPVALWAVWMGRRVKATSRELQSRLADLTEHAEEKLANIRTVLAFAHQAREVEVFGRGLDRVLNQAQTEALIHAKFYGLTGFSGNLIILSVLTYGGSLVAQQTLSVGELASFVLYAAYVGIGLNGLSNSYAEVMRGLGASQRIWELIDTQPTGLECARLPHTPLPSIQTAIRFQNLTFAFPTRPDTRVLRDFSLEIPAQQTLAVVGASGSGKSTLIALLLRLYEPQEGQILFDDQDIRHLNVSQHRRRIGLVPQEPVLFSSSISENIAYGLDRKSMNGDESRHPEDEAAISEMVQNAAREVNAHEFIMQFPDAYNTRVGDRGSFLSGGQRQRIAIARAIVKDPDILVLDEATSALDATNENIIRETIDRVRQNRTVIVIAHRLSTIRNADKIVILSDGQVKEEGSFQQLANTSVLFQDLIKDVEG
eukprot:maker-scaffold845_size89356-snap-gene-0.18 protein:Tk02766 transcript:maker-scaffold845_size89356-snap-gene-0.18-mRNA-1 annotation:"atp-binding cassette sub-family b member mitochondrial isoform x2"